MTVIHEALQALGPLAWSEVPLDQLASFLSMIFDAGELICDSIPGPAGSVHVPVQHGLNAMWGKPMKLWAKDNPLGVDLFKMASADKKGSWFARRSVHDGISFSVFRRAMQQEFSVSLAGQAGPSEGSVRGIGGDKRLEKMHVEGAGLLEVYQLSAQFPGPTSPREFTTLLATKDSDLTSAGGLEKHRTKKHNQRYYMVVSRPVTHPDAPGRVGFVRGTYESVELIREISARSSTDDEASSQVQGNPSNPVEWIMVTRSDPGGGIPRFMIERGTSAGICTDAVKMYDWACHRKDAIDQDAKGDGASLEPASQACSLSVYGISSSHRSSRQREHGAQRVTFPCHSDQSHEAGKGVRTAPSTSAHESICLPFDSQEAESSDDGASFSSAHEVPLTGLTHPVAHQSASASTPHSHRKTGLIEAKLQKLERQREKLDAKIARKREAELERLETLQRKVDANNAKALERHQREMRKLEERQRKELAKLGEKRTKEFDRDDAHL
ncbi:hypothetical protein D6C77_05757 [Aureobasidium pullulans]|nr:hypothetical protein D6C77_05757 [Aureobasidium pullulans]